ncbi:MAG: uncharacterized membrane protein (DUF4010 family) [Oleiphilaceae bacterium]|jgi:uncharacterized membrane protein (DUF4010 family)
MRTHALVGPLGGVSVVLADRITYWFLPATFIIIAVISISPYRARAAHTQNFSITGIIGLLLAFCFGALAASGELILATMSAIITTVILDNKDEIHKALRKLQ